MNLQVLLPGKICLPEVAFSIETVQAGFPSPAEDYSEERLDLHKKLVPNPASTFFVRVNGESMNGDGISHGDLLVVDRSLIPKNNSILICFIDGEFTVKRMKQDKSGCFLMPSNPDCLPVKVGSLSDMRIWGVVTYSIKKHY